MNPIRQIAATLAVVALSHTAALAQSPTPKGRIIGSPHFTQKDGASIYKAICADCHMPDAMGATGAGTYPALAKNSKLSEGGYPVMMVLNGHGAMPPFKEKLDDQQISEVVNYVRSHFGNAYPGKVTPDQVKQARGG